MEEKVIIKWKLVWNRITEKAWNEREGKEKETEIERNRERKHKLTFHNLTNLT